MKNLKSYAPMIVEAVDEVRHALVEDRDTFVHSLWEQMCKIVIPLNEEYKLSAVNNCHDFDEAWEEAAAFEVAILKRGHYLSDEAIVIGVDYHRFIDLLEAAEKLNLTQFFFWLFQLDHSRYRDELADPQDAANRVRELWKIYGKH